jgi:carbamoyltransferase
MAEYVLAFKPSPIFGNHDPSAALFEDGELIFGVEEERYTRQKHAVSVFPEQSIRACLSHGELEMMDLERVLIPYDPALITGSYYETFKDLVGSVRNGSVHERLYDFVSTFEESLEMRLYPGHEIENRLGRIGSPVPPIKFLEHHRCHAASAFHPTDFDEAIVLTIDGKGEYDSTVVWHATQNGLRRVRTYENPNSLGKYYRAFTAYLGFRPMNGEGKVMGLAPYGEESPEIEQKLREVMTFGVDYDVTGLIESPDKVSYIEDLFDVDRKSNTEHYEQFYKDLAFTVQKLLEETVTEIAERYLREFSLSTIGLAGGVALNCAMNRKVRELECVDDIFIQPVSSDAGLALGAGWLTKPPTDVAPMQEVYLGESSTNADIGDQFTNKKFEYEKVDEIERIIASQLADGALVGWFQGRQEMGPRALGNRSILADPRTEESRDRVNKYVKHREEWRPFAPSFLESKAEDYLVNATQSPFMIDTFETVPEKREEIEAVLHPANKTTRPQTVREEQNPRYFKLISEFEKITGVPCVLNTSFNDHGEPIVTTPKHAVQDFFTMGLDVLAIGDYLTWKPEYDIAL